MLFFTVSDFTSITSHIHNWVLFLLWLYLFILHFSGVISPLISSSILGTYRPGVFIFQCHIFLPFPTVHRTVTESQTTKHRKLTKLITWPRALSNSMKLRTMLFRATQDGQVMVEHSDKMWSTGEGNGKPLQYSCLENPMNNMKRPFPSHCIKSRGL